MSQDNQAKDISRPHHGYAKSNSSVDGYECTINAHREPGPEERVYTDSWRWYWSLSL